MHTTRVRLSIIPAWNPFTKPFFWTFKTLVAQRIGQANLSFNTQEAQRGTVSYIDTIDYPAEDRDHVDTVRGWVRACQDSGEAIYVGIYTIAQHNHCCLVSVGIPLPEANFTATPIPFNGDDGSLVLSTRDTGSRFPGTCLTDIDDDDGALTPPTFRYG